MTVKVNDHGKDLIYLFPQIKLAKTDDRLIKQSIIVWTSDSIIDPQMVLSFYSDPFTPPPPCPSP